MFLKVKALLSGLQAKRTFIYLKLYLYLPRLMLVLYIVIWSGCLVSPVLFAMELPPVDSDPNVTITSQPAHVSSGHFPPTNNPTLIYVEPVDITPSLPNSTLETDIGSNSLSENQVDLRAFRRTDSNITLGPSPLSESSPFSESDSLSTRTLGGERIPTSQESIMGSSPDYDYTLNEYIRPEVDLPRTCWQRFKEGSWAVLVNCVQALLK